MLFSKIVHRLGVWFSYAALSVASFMSFLFFRRLFNFARIYGLEHVPRQGSNVLFVANHDSMYDSFLIGGCAFFPRALFYPSEPFVNFAAYENFFSTWYMRFLMKLLRTEPVMRRDQGQLMRRFVQLLGKRNILIFYQGTRSKDLTQIKDGPAFAIRNKKPTPIVIPVYHEGMDRIFSRGGPKTKGPWRWLPRSLFRRPTVIFGPPIDLSLTLTIKDKRACTDAINIQISLAVMDLKAKLPR